MDDTSNKQFKYYVYKTTNIINNKFYIGVHRSKDIENDIYIGSGRNLKSAVKKYGRENFIREILFEFDNSEDAFKKESEIVTEDFLKEYNGVIYNMSPGGYGGRIYIQPPWLGKKHTEESKQKISESNKGKIISAEAREKESISQKKRLANMDKDKKIEMYRKIAEAGVGRPVSEETRKKLSIINKGKVITQETRNKISDAKKGKPNPRLAEINRDPEKIRKTVEKTKGKYKGKNSSNFKGYWVTPFGRFESIECAADGSFCSKSIIFGRCLKRQNEVITCNHILRSKNLNINDVGKTWKESGWGFDPIDKKDGI